MKKQPLFYGWLDPKDGSFRVSRYPADAPARPSVSFESKSDVDAMLARRRAAIMWWPPLPRDLSPQLR